MAYTLFHWFVSSAVFAPLVVGVPLLVLLVVFDEFVLRSQRNWLYR